MHRIVFAGKAAKDLASLDGNIKPRVFAALFELRKSPYLGKKLRGKLRDYYSLRVGAHRIIYRTYLKDKTILVVRIGHRQGIYK